MKIDTVYIISWFGKDSVREKRKEIHLRQLKFFKECNMKIVVYAQEYKDDEFQEGVEYIINDGKLKLPGHARNVLLEKFYNSDQDFAVFADNDSILYFGDKYKYGDGADIFSELERTPIENFKNVGGMVPINSINEGYIKESTENIEVYKDFFILKKSTACKGSLMFLKNIKKHHGKEIYFIEMVDHEGNYACGEDTFHPLQLIKEGLWFYSLRNCVLKEFGTIKSSTWSSTTDNRSVDGKDNQITIGIRNNFGIDLDKKQFAKIFHKPAPFWLRVEKNKVNNSNSLDDYF